SRGVAYRKVTEQLNKDLGIRTVGDIEYLKRISLVVLHCTRADLGKSGAQLFERCWMSGKVFAGVLVYRTIRAPLLAKPRGSYGLGVATLLPSTWAYVLCAKSPPAAMMF